MADTKISALTASTVPLAGTEVLPIVQSGTTKKVSVADLTAGRATSALSFASTVATGTAPLTVASTTRVANLNVATAGNSDTLQTKNGYFYLPNLLIDNRGVLDEKCYTSSGWNQWIGYGGGTTWSVVADGPPGKIQSCLEVVATGVAGWRSTDQTSATTVKNTSVRVIPGEVYTVSCEVKIVASGAFKPYIEFYDVAGAVLSNIIGSSYTGSTWQTATIAVTVPTNAAYMSVGGYAEVATARFGLFSMTKTI